MSQDGAMQTFTYYRAPLGEPVTVTLRENAISDGAVTLRLADIVHIRHVSRGSGRIRSDYFDLTGQDTTRIRLACSGPAASWGEEENSATFFDLLGRIMVAMARQKPDLTVGIEDAKGWRWAWFAVGLVTALLSAGIAGFAIYDGVDFDRMAPVVLVMGFLCLFGVAIAASNVPWRPGRTIPIARYSARFAQAHDKSPPVKSAHSA
jgi:hypothetical protein